MNHPGMPGESVEQIGRDLDFGGQFLPDRRSSSLHVRTPPKNGRLARLASRPSTMTAGTSGDRRKSTKPGEPERPAAGAIGIQQAQLLISRWAVNSVMIRFSCFGDRITSIEPS